MSKKETPEAVITDALRKKANEVFATHTIDELYATSDDMLFITYQEAANQAHNLPNHEILTIKKQNQ